MHTKIVTLTSKVHGKHRMKRYEAQTSLSSSYFGPAHPLPHLPTWKKGGATDKDCFSRSLSTILEIQRITVMQHKKEMYDSLM